MKPELDIFGLPVQTFGLFFALAFLSAGLILGKRFSERSESIDYAYEVGLVALVGGLIGSKFNYLLEHSDDIGGDLLGSIFSGSGLTWYGGAVGGGLAVIIWTKVRKFKLLELADFAAPALALGYAVGRVGCQISGDGDYGKASDLPWAMSYPEGVVPTTDKVHPTPVYESLTMGFFALFLWSLRDRFRTGVLFSIYLVGAGFERVLIEFLRRNDPVILGLTEAQLVSLGMIVAGFVVFLVSRPAKTVTV